MRCSGTPSHALRQAVNEHIRERLTRAGRIAGPVLQTQRLVSKGYTRAEKALTSNDEAADVVAFHRPYKRLGVEKGVERRVERVDRKDRTVHLEGLDGSTVAWKPSEIGRRQGGTEVYRCETPSIAPATVSAGPETTRRWAWSTAAWPRCWAFATGG